MCHLSPSGPDICGPGTKKVHVIFTYNGKNLLIKKDIRCKDDQFTHLYTLIVRPDNTYEVLIDSESAQKGSLEDDWDFLPPKMINDPDAKKPEDWDDNPKIDDPEDVKPEVHFIPSMHLFGIFCVYLCMAVVYVGVVSYVLVPSSTHPHCHTLLSPGLGPTRVHA